MNAPKVFLTMPMAGKEARCFMATYAFWHPGKTPVAHFPRATSSLPLTFGQAWDLCLNTRKTVGYTHFAMQHDDVVPLTDCWLDVMLAEMERVGADAISAVIPIKDERGLTSTCIDHSLDDPWTVRRLTMTECFERPVTFTDPMLGINTGLWIVKLGDWCEETWFQQLHRPVRLPDGSRMTQMASEDWDWSRMARREGAKLFATRVVELFHQEPRFCNNAAWGSWTRDEDYFPYAEAMAKKESQDHEANQAVLQRRDPDAGANDVPQTSDCVSATAGGFARIVD